MPLLQLMLAFLSGAVFSTLLIALGAWLYRAAEKSVAVPPAPVKPFEVYDRSDKAVRAMEDRRKSGISAVAPHGTNTVFDMQIEVP